MKKLVDYLATQLADLHGLVGVGLALVSVLFLVFDLGFVGVFSEPLLGLGKRTGELVQAVLELLILVALLVQLLAVLKHQPVVLARFVLELLQLVTLGNQQPSSPSSTSIFKLPERLYIMDPNIAQTQAIIEILDKRFGLYESKESLRHREQVLGTLHKLFEEWVARVG